MAVLIHTTTTDCLTCDFDVCYYGDGRQKSLFCASRANFFLTFRRPVHPEGVSALFVGKELLL